MDRFQASGLRKLVGNSKFDGLPCEACYNSSPLGLVVASESSKHMQLTIQLPPREEQLAFNRKRWGEVLIDRGLIDLPYRIETNEYGQILITPPASGGSTPLLPSTPRAQRAAVGFDGVR